MPGFITDPEIFLPRDPAVLETAAKYPMKVTEYYASLIAPGDLEDPVFRQFFPSPREMEDHGLSRDPFAEELKQHVPGLIHRYKNRAVLITGNICAVNCRHCMRKRNWSGKPFVISGDEIAAAAEYCRLNDIRDVIVSGGDPLMIPPEVLEEILERFSRIKSVGVIRIGTRIPVVDPDRVSERHMRLFSRFDNLFMLTHYNHPAELTPRSLKLLRRLKRHCTILNQSVLLKGVNDKKETLSALFMGLVSAGVKPYYLHQCDLVDSVTHFWVPPEEGLRLMNAVRREVSGIALPYYAIDLPMGKGKVLLGPEYRLEKEGDGYIFYDMEGKKALYGYDNR